MRHLVLVGGGHTHALVLLALAEAPLPDTRVTVLVDHPVAVYSGMVPGVVAGMYRPSEVEIELAPLTEAAGARLLLGTAGRVDPSARVIHVQEGDPVPYDLASFNIGSTVAGLQLPGVREHSLPTRPIGRFAELVDGTVARAPRHGGTFRVVVVGGGAGGVELAFTLLHRLRGEGVQVDATILDAGPRLLEGYPKGLRRRVHREAARDGVHIRCAAAVSEVTPTQVVLNDGDALPADAVVWAAGPASHPLFVESGLVTDARGFASTRSTLQLRDHDELFACGDCATLLEYPGTPKAGVYAVRQAPVLAANLRAHSSGGPMRDYRPQDDFLTLLNMGNGRALGSKRGISFSGRWVMALKDRIDRRFMGLVRAPTYGGNA
jgi:selenide,water dikinase